MLRGRFGKRDASICIFCRHQLCLQPSRLPRHRLFSVTTRCASDHDPATVPSSQPVPAVSASATDQKSWSTHAIRGPADPSRPPSSVGTFAASSPSRLNSRSIIQIGQRPARGELIDPGVAKARQSLSSQQRVQQVKDTLKADQPQHENVDRRVQARYVWNPERQQAIERYIKAESQEMYGDSSRLQRQTIGLPGISLTSPGPGSDFAVRFEFDAKTKVDRAKPESDSLFRYTRPLPDIPIRKTPASPVPSLADASSRAPMELGRTSPESSPQSEPQLESQLPSQLQSEPQLSGRSQSGLSGLASSGALWSRKGGDNPPTTTSNAPVNSVVTSPGGSNTPESDTACDGKLGPGRKRGILPLGYMTRKQKIISSLEDGLLQSARATVPASRESPIIRRSPDEVGKPDPWAIRKSGSSIASSIGRNDLQDAPRLTPFSGFGTIRSSNAPEPAIQRESLDRGHVDTSNWGHLVRKRENKSSIEDGFWKATLSKLREEPAADRPTNSSTPRNGEGAASTTLPTSDLETLETKRLQGIAASPSGFAALEEAGARDAAIKNRRPEYAEATPDWDHPVQKSTAQPKINNDSPAQEIPSDTTASPPKETRLGRWEFFQQEQKHEKKRDGKRSRGGNTRVAEDDEGDDSYDRYIARRQEKEQRKAQREAEQNGPIPIILPELISVTAFANALKIKPDDFVVQLGQLGFEGVSTDTLMAGETAALVAQEYGYEPTVEAGESQDLKPRPPPDDASALPLRPPVVTIMGHVDHGKTTILDYLRKSSVAAHEHGGITQHIGAFSVKLSSGKSMTFLDTPGHSAFLTMRQRGAYVTDIVVLVVAADDSVMPQTLEALKHARAAKVPIIVAINKIDSGGARIDAVKRDLVNAGVEIEDVGGDVQVVGVSGKTGQGMDDLEENILALSEILDHRAEFDGPAEGWVLESSLKLTGKVATVLVKRGTLRPGDYIAAGLTWAKIRELRNEAGAPVMEAPPGTPVEILGWRDLPAAGDQVIQSPDEDKAKTAVAYREGLREREKYASEHEVIAETRKLQREQRAREKAAGETNTNRAGGTGVQEILPDIEDGKKMVNFIVRADVHGSVEAVCGIMQGIGSNEVQPRILRSATGPITEFDIEQAAISKAVIVNFATKVPGHIQRLAESESVTIIEHTIIYHLIDEIKANLSGYLAPTITTRALGDAEVLQIFPINLRGRLYKNIAGCRVRNGVVAKNSLYRVKRKGEIIYEGKIETLKHIKKDIMEARKGTECGIGFEHFQDFEVGDQIQAYEEIKTERTL